MQRVSGHPRRVWAVTILVAGLLASAPIAVADVDNDTAVNVQEGDNSDATAQQGSAGSGDAVTGQVVGVVSSGDASLDATNRSEDADAASGDADGANTSSAFTGLIAPGCPLLADTACSADVSSTNAANVLEGDNDRSADQSIEAVTGDAVGGQVVGLVTSGTADLVLASSSLDVDVTSGDSDVLNVVAAETGLIAPLACCSVPSVLADNADSLIRL
jgi:hypothetical protein